MNSLEKYENFRGIEFGWLAIDELAFARVEAYNVLLGRLRCKRSHALEIRATSTPNGFNFMYDRYASGGYVSHTVTPDFHKDEYHQLISATAYDNTGLPEDYIPSMKSQYDPLLFQQEVMGEFINTQQGKIYWAFDRSLHLKDTVKTDIINPVAGCDFNVNPLTAIIGNSLSKEHFHGYSEVWLEHSNTFELAETLAEYEGLNDVAPDATGAARKTSASKTDHQILRDEGFNLLVAKKNPSRKDRFNNVNRWLSNGWLTIDPKLTHMINDLEKCTHEDDSDDMGHIADALGYILWRINPMKRAQRKSRVIN